MGTLWTIRFNPVIHPFADRLKASGKCNKVVMTAAMRKLLTILNAMLCDQFEWFQLKRAQNT